MPGVDADPGVLGHLVALIPGHGTTQSGREFFDRSDHGIGDHVGSSGVSGRCSSWTNPVERSTSVPTGRPDPCR